MTFRMLYLLAIVFVVDGHIPLEGELLNLGGLFRYYSFHMLLFAFGSGYFFNSDRSFKESFLRDCRHLLIPLYLYNLLYGLLAALFRKILGTTLGEPLSLYSICIAPIVDGQHFSYNLGAWFIGALFLVKTLYNGLYRMWKWTSASDIVTLILSLGLGSLAILYSQEVSVTPLSVPIPLFILRACILLPGYALGHVYRTRLEKMDSLPGVPYLTAILLLRLIYITVVPENACLLSDLTYLPCGPVALYAGGILAIAFYLRIARILSSHLSESTFLHYASRHTFDIMMHHGLGIFLTNILFLVLNKFEIGAGEFSVHQFRTAPGYVYAPAGAPGWAVLYVMTGIGFGCLAAWLTERGKGILNKK